MSIPIRGDEAVDIAVIAKMQEACEYAYDNRQQLSRETLEAVIAKLNETRSRLAAVVEWRIKQAMGGFYVTRLQKAIDGISERLDRLEKCEGTITFKEVIRQGEPVADAAGSVEAAGVAVKDETPAEGASEVAEDAPMAETDSSCDESEGLEPVAGALTSEEILP